MFQKIVAIEPVNLLPAAKERLHEFAKEVVLYDSLPADDEEIIRRPANRFVFPFIGASNFLPVTEKGGKVCLALGGEPVLFDAPPQGYVSGKKNVMGVRPMDIVFDAKSPIRATIQRDTFLGNQYDYQVELMGRELRVERNALDVLADPTRYEAGQEVGLKFLNVKFYEEEAKA